MENLTKEELIVLMQIISKITVPQTVGGRGDKDLSILRSIMFKLKAQYDGLDKKSEDEEKRQP